jgi:RNA polymerase sigma factor (sigma-70 family)
VDTLDTLYRRHAPSVFRRARRLLGNDADAQEIVQEVFVSLFERPEQYAARSALTTFLYSVTTHACLNRIRNRKTRLRILEQAMPAPVSRLRGEHRIEGRFHLSSSSPRAPPSTSGRVFLRVPMRAPKHTG